MFATRKMTAPVKLPPEKSYYITLGLAPDAMLINTLAGIIAKCANEHKLDADDFEIKLDDDASINLCSLGKAKYAFHATAAELKEVFNQNIPGIPEKYRHFAQTQLDESMELSFTLRKHSPIALKEKTWNGHVAQVDAVIKKFEKKEAVCFPVIHDFLLREKSRIERRKQKSINDVIQSALILSQIPVELAITEAYVNIKNDALYLRLRNDTIDAVTMALTKTFTHRSIVGTTFFTPVLMLCSKKGAVLPKEFAESVTRELQSLSQPVMIAIASPAVHLCDQDGVVLNSFRFSAILKQNRIFSQPVVQAEHGMVAREFELKTFGKSL